MKSNPRKPFAIYALTKHGAQTAVKLADLLPTSELFLSHKVVAQAPGRAKILPLPMGDFLGANFAQYDCHIFVISVGAVVRMMAPYLVSKKVDPAVICIDDDGKFAICTLSGHVGRGNEFTYRVASLIGALPVVTTASDVRGTLTVDILGRELGWTLADPDFNVTRGCAAVVNEEPVAVIQECGESSWWPVDQKLPPGVSYFTAQKAVDPSQFGIVLMITDRAAASLEESLYQQSVVYHPKSLVLGIGCDRGTSAELLERGVLLHLREAGLALASVAEVATIDLKADEPGLLELCKKYGWPLKTFSPAELDGVVGTENPSATVKAFTGTRGVAEPASLLAANATKLTLAKQKYTEPQAGRTMTLAIARRPFVPRQPQTTAAES